jgi:nucleotide-binding universal stress UspA family protein
MSYKSIITYNDDEADAAGRLHAAIALARHFDAHLVVLALAYEPDFFPASYGEIPAAAIAEWHEKANLRARELAERTNASLREAAVKGEAKPLVSSASGLARLFRSEAFFADLALVSGADGRDDAGAVLDMVEDAVFHADATTLICPKSVSRAPGNTVLIAWNGGREAMRAVRRAMPFLRRASRIEIAMVDPEASDGAPGGDLALFLSRHGLSVDVTSLTGGGERASAVLRRRILDLGADLLVMGAYGHSRLREIVLGGVTRDFLRDPPVATLMAH